MIKIIKQINHLNKGKIILETNKEFCSRVLKDINNVKVFEQEVKERITEIKSPQQ